MQDPALYDKQNKCQKRVDKKFLKNHFKLIDWKKADNKVIDIGCGTSNVTVGVLLPKLPKSVKSLIGVDLSDRMIDFASKRNPNKRVEYKALDIETKDLPEKFKGRFDQAFSFFCLNWVQDQKITMQNPEFYDTQNRKQKIETDKFLINYFKVIQWRHEDESVIDIGCGTGNVTVDMLLPKLPKNIKRVVGVDSNDKMLDFASKNHPNERVEYKTLNIETEDLPEEFKESFDKAFSFFCLHWVQNQRQALWNINKMLKSGGGFFANIVGYHPIYDVYDTMAKGDKWSLYTADYKKYVTPYQNSDNPEEEIKKNLEEAGFKVILCKERYEDIGHGDVSTTRNFFSSLNPFKDRIPKSLIEEYLDELIFHLKKHNKNKSTISDEFILYFKTVEFYAVKIK